MLEQNVKSQVLPNKILKDEPNLGKKFSRQESFSNECSDLREVRKDGSKKEGNAAVRDSL